MRKISFTTATIIFLISIVSCKKPSTNSEVKSATAVGDFTALKNTCNTQPPATCLSALIEANNQALRENQITLREHSAIFYFTQMAQLKDSNQRKSLMEIVGRSSSLKHLYSIVAQELKDQSISFSDAKKACAGPDVTACFSALIAANNQALGENQITLQEHSAIFYFIQMAQLKDSNQRKSLMENVGRSSSLKHLYSIVAQELKDQSISFSDAKKACAGPDVTACLSALIAANSQALGENQITLQEHSAIFYFIQMAQLKDSNQRKSLMEIVGRSSSLKHLYSIVAQELKD
jgi:hypothetical protein